MLAGSTSGGGGCCPFSAGSTSGGGGGGCCPLTTACGKKKFGQKGGLQVATPNPPAPTFSRIDSIFSNKSAMWQ